MKQINMTTWNRREHFDFFYRMDHPQYNVCAEIDVTVLLQKSRTKGVSFYYAMIYWATKATEQVPNFRYRIREGMVVEHEQLNPSFTDIESGDDLFKIVVVSMKETLEDFVEHATDASNAQKCYFDHENLDKSDDMLYISCAPWVSFTSVSHAFALNRDDSIPRITWGKYYEFNEKWKLPISVEVNHALVDGIHVARYLEVLQTLVEG